MNGATGPHFSSSELQCRGTRCSLDGKRGCGVNGCTQRLIDALEEFRALVGKPLIIDSAYRCSRYNSATPNAAKGSEHTRGEAADIRVTGMTAAEMEAVARKVLAIRGIGRDDHKGYIHIDVRNTLTLARWTYDANGKWIAYQPASEKVA